MKNAENELDRLAGLLAERAKRKKKGTPQLRVVGKEAEPAIALPSPRDVLMARIKDFARMYWLAWLVRQETAFYGKALEELSDDELGELMRRLEDGRDCRVEGISFDERGLVRHSLGESMGY